MYNICICPAFNKPSVIFKTISGEFLDTLLMHTLDMQYNYKSYNDPRIFNSVSKCQVRVVYLLIAYQTVMYLTLSFKSVKPFNRV